MQGAYSQGDSYEVSVYAVSIIKYFFTLAKLIFFYSEWFVLNSEVDTRFFPLTCLLLFRQKLLSI